MSTISPESYPPPFRLLGQSKPPTSPESFDSDDDVVFDHPIPRIDLQNLVDRTDEHDKARLGEACRDWGVFRLVNHGIPETLLTRLEDCTRELFSLSFEAKTELFSATPLSYFWGTPALTPSGTALSKGPPHSINWVEGLNVLLSHLSQIQHHHHQQKHTTALASYGAVLEEYGKHLGRVARAIFGAMSENLGLDSAESKPDNLCESTGLLRVYRYPHYSGGDDDDGPSYGMDEHTDSSVMSILNQDQVGGLEVFKDGQWFGVKPLSNTLIVNLGDMMQAISDDRYKSVKHRVRVNKCKERVSICYFVFPGEGSVIRCSKYKPFTYSDFQAQVQRDIKSLGYKVGLERFKLSAIINTNDTTACQ